MRTHILCFLIALCAAVPAYATEGVPERADTEKSRPEKTAPAQHDAASGGVRPGLPVHGQDGAGLPAGDNGRAPESPAPASKPKGDPEDAQALFQESLRQMMPLSREQIQEYREKSDQRERALLPVTPSLGSRTVKVSLEPGRAPVVVRTTAHVASALVFHDATGRPWPITSVTNGAPGAFQVLRPDLPERNLINVMPVQPYGSASLVVTLAEQDIPLVIRLESDSVRSPVRNADGLVLFRLAHFGPNAQPPITREIRDTASSVMMAILDHVPPAEAKIVRTRPGDDRTELWRVNDTHYLRTTHTVMWPAWTASTHGAGGIRCYELPVTSRIMLSRNGRVDTLLVDGEAGQ